MILIMEYGMKSKELTEGQKEFLNKLKRHFGNNWFMKSKVFYWSRADYNIDCLVKKGYLEEHCYDDSDLTNMKFRFRVKDENSK